MFVNLTRMALLYRMPPAPLSRFVAVMWMQLWDGARQGSSYRHERLMPSGEAELIFHLELPFVRTYEMCGSGQLRERRLPRAALCGPHMRPFLIDAAPENVVGVHFRPGGIFPFFAPPASELANAHIALEDLWGSVARELQEQLLTGESPDEKFAVLSGLLLRRLRENRKPGHPAVSFTWRTLECAPRRTMTQITNEIGLSRRHLIHRFEQEVGLAPKAFARVRRFQRVLRDVHPQAQVDWAEVALDCGYYDQAHFIHEFREFSGMTPSAYFAHRTRHSNHVAAES